jgi:dihydrofolate synthase/folylpolyglutamate synthase
VRLPAALEPFPGEPLVVLDGAHTAVSARAARDALAGAWPGRRHALLVGLLAEKDAGAILAALVPGAAAVVATTVDSPRALAAADLAALARRHGAASAEAVPDPRAALARARALTPPDALLLVTGSLYLAGALRPALVATARTPATPGS